MKKLFGKASALLLAAMLFVTSSALTLTASAETQENIPSDYLVDYAVNTSAEDEGTGTYISALSGLVMTKEDLIRGYSMENVDFQKNVNMLSERGYSSLWFDFNKNAYTDGINSYSYFAPFALGYQTTADKNDAITGLVVYNGENPAATMDINGITYNVMGGWEFKNSVEWVEALDFNRFTRGDFLYLYYTKDVRAGAPVAALKGSESSSESGYECVLETSGNTADLNSGSDMDQKCTVYLHFVRNPATTGSVFGGGNLAIILIIVGAIIVVGAVITIVVLKGRRAKQ